jgi:hypothetical protein
MLARQALLLGTCSERTIVNELKDTKNIEKTCQKFEVAIDTQRINKHLLEIRHSERRSKNSNQSN